MKKMIPKTPVKHFVIPMKPLQLGKPSEIILQLCHHSVPSYCETAYYGEALQSLGWIRLRPYDAPSVWYFENSGGNAAFYAHLDTVAAVFKPLNLVKYGEFLGCDNGWLGGDCRGGVAIVLYLAHVVGLKGKYFLTECEETGMIGINNALDVNADLFIEYDMAISLDRKGTSDCITTQLGSTGASTTFAELFCEELLFKGGLAYDLADGLVTDTYNLFDIIPQVLNLSIGYYYNHSKSEVISLDHIDKLGRALSLLEWENLGEVAKEAEWEKELSKQRFSSKLWDNPSDEWTDEKFDWHKECKLW